MSKKKNPYAVALGSLGGKKRAQNLSPQRRKEIARQGGLARRKSKEPTGAIAPDGTRLSQWDERLRASGCVPTYD